MADREKLRATAARCLALARSTTDPQARAALTIMAQKLYDMASGRPADFEAAQRAFNDEQMMPRPTRRQPRTK